MKVSLHTVHVSEWWSLNAWQRPSRLWSPYHERIVPHAADIYLPHQPGTPPLSARQGRLRFHTASLAAAAAWPSGWHSPSCKCEYQSSRIFSPSTRGMGVTAWTSCTRCSSRGAGKQVARHGDNKVQNPCNQARRNAPCRTDICRNRSSAESVRVGTGNFGMFLRRGTHNPSPEQFSRHEIDQGRAHPSNYPSMRRIEYL